VRGRLILLIFVGAAVLVISSVLLYRGEQGMELFPNRTTFSSRPGGYKALYLTLEEIGYPPVGRWREPLSDFTRPEDALVITSLRPGQSISRRERDVIQEWVQDGGRLILLGHVFTIEPGFGDILESFDLVIDTGEEPMPFGEMPSAVHGVEPVQPTAYTRGVEQVEAASSLRLTTSRSDHVVHLEDEKGIVCASYRHGNGKLIAVSDVEIGSNQWVDRANNLRFLLNVLTQEAGAGTVWFDEYHHGFPEMEGLSAYAGRSQAGPIVVQLVAVALVWLMASTRRFGPLRALPPPEARQTAEHVDCLASMYASVGARSYALREIYRKFRTDVARRAGLPLSVDTAQLAMTYADKFGYNSNELRRVMLRCEYEQEWEDLSFRDVLRLVRSLEQFAPLRRR
jgi:hypothetical protein